MNNKKENILNDNVLNFIEALEKLDFAYSNNSELNICKFPCIVERYATRLITHFEDWTTATNDMQYRESINTKLQNSILHMHENLKQFIKEQQDIDSMMYYTYKLLHCAKII